MKNEGLMSVEAVVRELRSKSNPKAVEGMARFGISPENTFGISVPTLRGMAKRLGRDHRLASGLWESGIHEARILAALVDEPTKVTENQMERWVKDFDSWDVCDCCCSNLFDRTSFAHSKALEWAGRKEEFVKRAGYTMMAALAVHDRKAGDGAFLKFFGAIEAGSTDERNFVKKAVNWALRQIGKRNQRLNREALALAKKISKKDSRSARWVTSDATGELSSQAVAERLRHSS